MLRTAAYNAKFRIRLREYVRDRTVSKKARRNVDCARMMSARFSNVKQIINDLAAILGSAGGASGALRRAVHEILALRHHPIAPALLTRIQGEIGALNHAGNVVAFDVGGNANGQRDTADFFGRIGAADATLLNRRANIFRQRARARQRGFR